MYGEVGCVHTVETLNGQIYGQRIFEYYLRRVADIVLTNIISCETKTVNIRLKPFNSSLPKENRANITYID